MSVMSILLLILPPRRSKFMIFHAELLVSCRRESSTCS